MARRASSPTFESGHTLAERELANRHRVTHTVRKCEGVDLADPVACDLPALRGNIRAVRRYLEIGVTSAKTDAGMIERFRRLESLAAEMTPVDGSKA